MKKRFNRQIILEYSIYIIGWLLVFLTPVLDSKLSGESALNWRIVTRSWLYLFPFALFFFLHNSIAKRFFFKKKYTLYAILSIICLITIFTFYPKLVFYEIDKNGMQLMHPKFNNEQQMGPGQINPGDKAQPPFQHKDPANFEKGGFPEKRFGDNGFPQRRPDRFRRRPLINFMSIDSIVQNSLIAVLLAGLNLAVMLFFKLIDEQNKQNELRSNSLLFELEYLKGQLNPHFFMNMLNNIHALVDIDKDKAKETIIGFSKLMRYVLYDANQQKIQLSKEINFLRNYIELMKLRFTKNVDIRPDLPVIIPEILIPPLLFVSFIENAFKHGVSYRHKSFVDLSLVIMDEYLVFEITNSVVNKESSVDPDPDKENDKGIGLINVVKRLDLLYGDSYTLNIDKTEKEYKVKLTLPV
jgi:hypothetical protein